MEQASHPGWWYELPAATGLKSARRQPAFTGSVMSFAGLSIVLHCSTDAAQSADTEI